MNQDVVTKLSEALDKLVHIRDAHSEVTPRIHRIVLDIDSVDPLDWLRSQSQNNCLYWQDRDDRERVAAVGEADVVTISSAHDLPTALQRITNALQHADPGVRYFGGHRFDPSRPESTRDNRWDEFGTARFVLPRFELTVENGKCRLACHVTARDLETSSVARIVEAARRFSFDSLSEAKTPLLIGRADSPDRAVWNDLIEQLLDTFSRGDCEKVVLARRTTLEFGAAIDPWHLLKRLRDHNKNCFVFGFQFDQSAAFVGATPERLYRREDVRIQTEAIAGTRPIVAAKPSDDAFAAELLESTKDRAEHEMVVDAVAAVLDQACERYSITESCGLLRLQSLQHLITRFEGQLRGESDDSQLLAALHPTPAVGGSPVSRAIELLRTREPFDRGWYSGPVGWVGVDRAEFVVAIRSALVHDSQVDVFAGAGIVPGSDPDLEWIEVENKILPFLILLYGGQL